MGPIMDVFTRVTPFGHEEGHATIESQQSCQTKTACGTELLLSFNGLPFYLGAEYKTNIKQSSPE